MTLFNKDRNQINHVKAKVTDNAEKSLQELKSRAPEKQETLQSKMPSMTGESDVDLRAKIEIPVPKKQILSTENSHDSSILFKEGPEISRRHLEHNIKRDPEFRKAARKAGLNLASKERSELVGDVFSRALGKSISKSDLKTSLRKLNRRMVGSHSSQEHAKIRKEIKFFKKIGGI